MTMWQAQTSRERQIVRELNDARQEVERLRHDLIRAQARIKQLEQSTRTGNYPRTDLTPPPAERGRVLRPGEPGYTTRITITAQGRKLINEPVGVTQVDVIILVLAAHLGDAGVTFDQVVKNVPRALADRAKVARFTSALSYRGLIQIDYLKDQING